MRLIDAEALIRELQDEEQYGADYYLPIELLKSAPTIEVVPKELYEQILWERNIAMEQLEEHGIGFASKKE